MTVTRHELQPGVATLMLDRPEHGNAFEPVMLAALCKQLAEIEADPAIRAIVLRGAGKHFCVGADLNWHRATSVGAPDGKPGGPTLIDALLALDRVSKPVVGIVHGACIGGGVAFAACCDIVLAEQRAFFAVPEVRIGMSVRPLLPFFARAMNPRTLRRLLLTGERIGAVAAQTAGLVHDIFASADEAQIRDPALHALMLGAPGALADTKRAMAEMTSPPLDAESLQRQKTVLLRNLASAETTEGLAAYFEKRRPNWYPAKTGAAGGSDRSD
jgi:methylglutaconyl-CoA hydratase